MLSKIINCRICGEKFIVNNVMKSGICKNCSNKHQLCICCGASFEDGSYVDGIKVLKQGIMSKTTVEFTCCVCGCIFNVMKGFYKTEYGERNDSYCVANCPTCGERVAVER
jgi:hypothetical protein